MISSSVSSSEQRRSLSRCAACEGDSSDLLPDANGSVLSRTTLERWRLRVLIRQYPVEAVASCSNDSLIVESADRIEELLRQ